MAAGPDKRSSGASSDSAAVVNNGSCVESEVPRDVLTWVVLCLAAWLAIGVLAAKLFGAFASRPDADDQDLTKKRRS